MRKDLEKLLVVMLNQKKAEDIVSMPISKESMMVDHMIFATGRSVKNITSTAEHIALDLKHQLSHETFLEGLGSEWVLIDTGDVLIHLFSREKRDELKLERLWCMDA